MKLEKILKLENISIDFEAKAEGGSKAKEIFCDKWDEARAALDLIVLMVKNPIVKLIVTLVIAVGDGIKTKVCP